jgi:hypothetical protein
MVRNRAVHPCRQDHQPQDNKRVVDAQVRRGFCARRPVCSSRSHGFVGIQNAAPAVDVPGLKGLTSQEEPEACTPLALGLTGRETSLLCKVLLLRALS